MGLTGTNRGSGSHNSSSTSFTLSPASNFSAGSWAVIVVAADNGGGRDNDFTSVTDDAGNTWTLQRTPVRGTASLNGIQGLIATTDMTGGTLTTSSVITVSTTNNATAKVWGLIEVSASGGTISYLQGANGTTGTGTVISVTTASITDGNIVICLAGIERGSTTFLADSDTTNGSWSTSQTATVGSGASGMAFNSQFKVVNASGAQIYSVVASGASDFVSCWIELAFTPITTSLKDLIGGTNIIPYLR